MSYYARIGFDPFPVTHLTAPHKLAKSGKPHDDMWNTTRRVLRNVLYAFGRNIRNQSSLPKTEYVRKTIPKEFERSQTT